MSAEFFCVSCRTPFQNAFPLDEEGRCGLCRSGWRGFDSAYSYSAYDRPLRRLIHLFQYEKAQPLAGPLSDVLTAALPRDQRFDCIAPRPLYCRRRWQRAVNQADRLAGRLSSRTGIPVIRALRRIQCTQTQAGLSNTARRRNVAQAFRVGRGMAVEGKQIRLVDDVMTTGSTASACAAALKRAGAAKVALSTIARVDRRMDVRSIDVRHTNRARMQQAASAAGENE